MTRLDWLGCHGWLVQPCFQHCRTSRAPGGAWSWHPQGLPQDWNCQYVTISDRRRIARQGAGCAGGRVPGRRGTPRRADRRRTPSPSGRLWPRRPATARSRSRRRAQRPLAGRHLGQSHRLGHSQQGLQDRSHGRPALPAPRPWRSERIDEVPGPDPGRAGAGHARETAARVAAGALAKQLLAPLGITAFGYVAAVGPITIAPRPGTLDEQRALRDQSVALLPQPGAGRGDQDADRPGATVGRHVGGRHRGPRRGRPLRTGHAHAMGQAARRPPGPGGHGGAGDQGRWRSAWGSRRPGIRAPKVHDPIGYDAARAGTTYARLHAPAATTPAGWRPA